VGLQWEGQTRSLVNGAGDVGACRVGTLAAHICAMKSWMSAIALESVALVATRLSMVVFFWIDAFARLSREYVIYCACSSLVAWLAPKDISLPVMQLMSCILAKAVVQWVFQLGHV
jgi:hypothetical protein